jgi:RNA polymerase sigma factor (sigma-70 family)
MNDDMVLLREFAANQSEPAFASLVERYIGLVHSAAVRQAGDAHLAQEMTQAVFIILARKAGSLGADTILPAWLYRTTRYVAADALKIQRRRQRREQEAYMQSTLAENESDTAWAQLSPLLDEAMAELAERDRSVLVLRYFENKSAREIAVALQMEESTAQKRVVRALEKLRAYFAKRGVVLTATLIAGAISANSVQAVPATMAKTITAVAVVKGASESALTLVKGALKIMAWTKAKVVIVVAVGLVLATGTTVLVVQHQSLPKAQPVATGQTEFPRASWAFAGYGDPRSALMSYLWASCRSDDGIFVHSLTSAEKQKYEWMINMMSKVPRQSSHAEAVARTASIAENGWRGGGYQIVDQKVVSADAVVLHVYAQVGGKQIELNAKMRKIGKEWKYDGYDNKKSLFAN